jgi:hypothetical protein
MRFPENAILLHLPFLLRAPQFPLTYLQPYIIHKNTPQHTSYTITTPHSPQIAEKVQTPAYKRTHTTPPLITEWYVFASFTHTYTSFLHSLWYLKTLITPSKYLSHNILWNTMQNIWGTELINNSKIVWHFETLWSAIWTLGREVC